MDHAREREESLRVAENVSLRKENEKLLMEVLTLQGKKGQDGDAGKNHNNGGGGIGSSSTAAARLDDDERALYEEFRHGGTGRMASEVRKMVGASGELLKKIDEYEHLKRTAERMGVKKNNGGDNDDDDNEDGKSERFYSPSPYLYPYR